jgi:hypothetical protein
MLLVGLTLRFQCARKEEPLMEQQLQQRTENIGWTRDIASRKKETGDQVDQKEEDPKETKTIEEQRKQNE